MRAARRAALAAACATLSAGGASAQVSVGVSVDTYTFDAAEAAGVARFRLVTVPWAASAGMGDATLGVSGAWAEGTATGSGGGEATLSGPTDTNLWLGYAVRDWLVVSADASLPTGRARLSNAESVVAGIVAADLLPVAVNSWGSGPRVGGTVSMARQVGPWGVGFAAGYRVATRFEPVPDAPITYDPGDQVQARMAFDRDVGTSSTLSLVVGFQHFTDDRVSESNLFQAGSRLEGTVGLAFPLGLRSSALLYGGVNHRSRGTLLLEESVLSGAGDSPSQQLFLAGGSARVPFGRSVALLPLAEVRVFRAGDGASQGWVGSLGATFDLRLAGNSSSRRLVLSPGGGLRLGNVVVDEGSEVSFDGWEARVTLRVEGS